MVKAAKASSKCVQIGYQRRSNPNYHHVLYKLLREAYLPERLTQVQTRWVLGPSELAGWPRRRTHSR